MSPTFRSLANPNYRRYAAGGVVSNVGTWMQRVAQDWLVLQLTGYSGAAIGITTGLQFLPFLLLSPFAGLVADRIPKRRLLQMTNLGMAVPALILGLLAVTGTAQIWHVYVLAFVLGTAAAFDAPARQSFVSEIVDKDDLTNAVGLNSASFNAARIVGPARRRRPDRRPRRRCGRHRLGDPGQRGQLRRADHDPAQPRRVGPAHPEADGPRAGPDPGRRRATSAAGPTCCSILAIVFFTGTFGLNFQITSALMATQVFDKGATEYGLLGTFMAVGSLTGSLVAARRKHVRHRLVIGAALAFAVGRDRGRPDAVVPHLRADDAAARPLGADHDHRRQRLHAAAHRRGNARPGDGAVHDDLHRRHAARARR